MRFLNKLIYLLKRSLYHIFPYYEYSSKSKEVWVRIKEIDSFKFQVGEFGKSLEKIEPLLTKLGKPKGDFSNIQGAVQWLNDSIESFNKYVEYIQNNGITADVGKLLPEGFKTFSKDKFENLARTPVGQELKRLILSQLYPQETPKRQIDSDNLQYVERLDGFKETDILSFYDRTLEIKKSLEEKSKSILLSITVAITLIIGLITIFSNHNNFSSNPQLLTFIIFFVGLISVTYMVIGAVMTLKLLSDRIQLYQLFPVDTALGEAEKVKLIAINTEQNVNMNIIRSNIVYIAHKSIINSLICLLILLLLFSVNLIFGNQNKADDYNKLKADVAQISSKVKGIESNLMNNGWSTAKKVDDLLDKIQSLEYEIKKMENAQKKK